MMHFVCVILLYAYMLQFYDLMYLRVLDTVLETTNNRCAVV